MGVIVFYIYLHLRYNEKQMQNWEIMHVFHVSKYY